jgi:hypothetical protein
MIEVAVASLQEAIAGDLAYAAAARTGADLAKGPTS